MLLFFTLRTTWFFQSYFFSTRKKLTIVWLQLALPRIHLCTEMFPQFDFCVALSKDNPSIAYAAVAGAGQKLCCYAGRLRRVLGCVCYCSLVIWQFRAVWRLKRALQWFFTLLGTSHAFVVQGRLKKSQIQHKYFLFEFKIFKRARMYVCVCIYVYMISKIPWYLWSTTLIKPCCLAWPVRKFKEFMIFLLCYSLCVIMHPNNS